MSSPTFVRTVLVGVAGLLVTTMTACAPEVDTTDQTGAQPVATPDGTGNGTNGTGTAPVTGQTTPSGEVDSRWYDLMHVPQTASPCAMVWNVGAVLPADYTWCADPENNAVAGVRVGPCEVVSYNRTMYAVPGQTINGVVGTLDRDQNYLDLLTACKRKPFASGSSRKEAR